MEKINLKYVIQTCINNILIREQKEYAKLNEIYEEVASYLEIKNDKTLQSQIRGRLQEGCEQYTSFLGESLFYTEKPRSGNWTTKKLKKANKKKYIRYINNTFLITNNNWVDVEVVSSLNEQYILEDNSDSAYKARLIEQLGKTKANIIVEELNYIRKQLKTLKGIDKVNDGYGTAFEVFFVSVMHNLSYEEAINKYIVHGDYDGKIDAIYYDLENVYIYQIKLDDISDNAYDEMEDNYIACIRDEKPSNGKDLYKFIKKNEEKLSGKVMKLRSVSNNSRKRTNYKPIEIYDMFFKNKLLPLNSNEITLSIFKPYIDSNEDDNNERRQYNVSTDGNNNYSFYIKASNLIKYLLEALGINPKNYDKDTVDISKYFFDNVRGVLSVNKKMVYTIENEPKNFVKYNNGINITGEVKDTTGQIIIRNPIINNGQQTITTLIRIGKNLDKITIPVKVTNEIDMIVKSKISQYSNEQVKVKAIDMLSLNPYVRDIQTIIFNNKYNDESYFLEIYSSGKKYYYDIMMKLYKKNNIIDLLDFIKLYYSVENPKDLGAWKNSPNMQIERTKINDYFDRDKAFKVCEATAIFDDFIGTIKRKKEKDDLKSADLAFKYLLCKENLSIDDALYIIDSINKKYYYDLDDKKSKLIDIYKSPSIINKLQDELNLYKNDKNTIKII